MGKPREEQLGSINNLDSGLSGFISCNNALIQDPSGIEFAEQASVATLDTFWVSSGSPSQPKFTNNQGTTITLGSGGGGGGSETLAQTLGLGNETDGYNIVLNSGSILTSAVLQNLSIISSEMLLLEATNSKNIAFFSNSTLDGYIYLTNGVPTFSFYGDGYFQTLSANTNQLTPISANILINSLWVNSSGNVLEYSNNSGTSYNVVLGNRNIGTNAPLSGGGTLSGDLSLSISGATTGAVGVIQLAGDLGGSATSPSVVQIHGASVPAAGLLTTGNVLIVSGGSSLTYGTIGTGSISSSGTINQILTTNAGNVVAWQTLTLTPSAPLSITNSGNLATDATISVNTVSNTTSGVVPQVGSQYSVLNSTGTASQWSLLAPNNLFAGGSNTVLLGGSVSDSWGQITDGYIAIGAGINPSKLTLGGNANILLGGNVANYWGQIVDGYVAVGAAINPSKLTLGGNSNVLLGGNIANYWGQIVDGYVATNAAINQSKLVLGGNGNVLLGGSIANYWGKIVDGYISSNSITTASLNAGGVANTVLQGAVSGNPTWTSSPTVVSLSATTDVGIGATPAGAGALRLSNDGYIGWQNAAGNGTISGIVVDPLNNLCFYGTQTSNAQMYLTSAGGLIVDGYISIGNVPATSGNIRLPNSADVNFRNAANNADLVALTVDGYNNYWIGPYNLTNLYTNVVEDPSGWILPGFTNTSCTVTATAGTRTLTVAPTGTNYIYYIEGQVYTSTSQSVVWTATEGQWYFYFDTTGVLQTTQDSSIWGGVIGGLGAGVAIIYWDNTNSLILLQEEERHGTRLAGSTHSYLHTYFHTQYNSGLAFGNFTIQTGGAEGSSNAGAQFSVANGIAADEDITITVTNGSPQTLSTTANIPIFYLSGSTPVWRKKTADAYPFIESGTAGFTGTAGRAAYNLDTAGTWSLSTVGQNDFFHVYYFVTNDVNTPIIGILGQAAYTSAAAADTAVSTEAATVLSFLPSLVAEYKLLAAVVFQTNSGYANAVNTAIVNNPASASFYDYRQNGVSAGIGAAGTNIAYSSLTGQPTLTGTDPIQVGGVSGTAESLSTNLTISLTAGGANTVLLGGAASDSWGQITDGYVAVGAGINPSKLTLGGNGNVLLGGSSANYWGKIVDGYISSNAITSASLNAGGVANTVLQGAVSGSPTWTATPILTSLSTGTLAVSSGITAGSLTLSEVQTFGTPGAVVLPAWLTFTGPSGRTAQTSLSTVVQSIGSNQAVVNLWGLQHEPQSTNYCSYSETFTSWINGSTGVYYGAVIDPAGNSTGADIGSTGAYGWYTGTSGSFTTFTNSIWVAKSSASPSQFIFTAADGGFATIETIHDANIAAGWHRETGTYNSTSKTLAVAVIDGSGSDGAGTAAPRRGLLAFAQIENLIYATSYIPNTSTGSTTRNATTLICAFASASSPYIDVTFTAAYASTYACTFLGDGTNTIGFNSSGKATSFFNVETKTGSNTYTWAAGNLVRIIVSMSGPTAQWNIAVYVNGVLNGTETISHTMSFSFSTANVYLGSNGTTGHVPALGYSIINAGGVGSITCNSISAGAITATSLPSFTNSVGASSGIVIAPTSIGGTNTVLQGGTTNTWTNTPTITSLTTTANAFIDGYVSIGSPSVGAGLLQLSNDGYIGWANVAGTNVIPGIVLDPLNNLCFYGTQSSNAQMYLTSAGGLNIDGYIAVGTNPAKAGTIRIPSATSISARNGANNVDTNILSTDVSNNTIINGLGNSIIQYQGVNRIVVNSATVLIDSTTLTFGTGINSPSTIGFINFANNETYIASRNSFNNLDVQFVSTDSFDNLYINSIRNTYIQYGGYNGGNGTTIVAIGNGYISIGTTPAQNVGIIRLPNATGIYARSQDNTKDIPLIFTDTSNNTIVGGSNNIVFQLGISLTTALTITPSQINSNVEIGTTVDIYVGTYILQTGVTSNITTLTVGETRIDAEVIGTASSIMEWKTLGHGSNSTTGGANTTGLCDFAMSQEVTVGINTNQDSFFELFTPNSNWKIISGTLWVSFVPYVQNYAPTMGFTMFYSSYNVREVILQPTTNAAIGSAPVGDTKNGAVLYSQAGTAFTATNQCSIVFFSYDPGGISAQQGIVIRLINPSMSTSVTGTLQIWGQMCRSQSSGFLA